MNTALSEVALIFLRLGCTAFGGPAAHVAIMREEFVRRRNWLTEREFLDLWSVAQLIPGPNSTELAIHLGFRRAGWIGLVVAGVCFILPAAAMVGGLAWGYVEYGTLPQALGALSGIKPVVVAILAHAVWGLARSALTRIAAAVIAIASAIAVLAGLNELIVLFAAGAIGAGRRAAILAAPLAAASIHLGLGAIFLYFLKLGAVLFGSGYVLVAFLRGDLVERWGWLTEAQLLDAIAAGQVTPGPLFTTATFIGYVLAGAPGAAVATAGIFLPAFVLVAATAPWIPRLRESRRASGFLDAVNAASVGLVFAVAVDLGRSVVTDLFGTAIAIGSLAALFLWRINPVWLIAAGAAAGWFWRA